MIIIKRLTSPGKKTYLKCEGREFTGIVVRYARKNDKYATRKNEKYATRKSEKYATRKKRP